ncbi:hypothetical protein TWF102_008356 [Orbilia oligospora]|uniref:Uncharacterized protein n=1 Tax=Orbilia oligospora TaxID=2813651 RepID=A0A7C8J865_ORBOL|nr:hypothetical protein TWF102_008356 [Orbilia oligospora]
MLTIQKNRHASDRCHGHKLSYKRENEKTAPQPCVGYDKQELRQNQLFADRNSNPSYDYINPNFLLKSSELAPLSWDGLDLSPETGFAPTSDQTSKQSKGTLISTTNFPDLFDGEALEYRKLVTSPTNTVPTANFTAPYFFDYDPTSVGLSGRQFTLTSGHENKFSTKGNWIDRVAELHVRLYIQHGSQDRSAQNFAAATNRFNVGETFALSQNLLEIQKWLQEDSVGEHSVDPLTEYHLQIGSGNDRASCSEFHTYTGLFCPKFRAFFIKASSSRQQQNVMLLAQYTLEGVGLASVSKTSGDYCSPSDGIFSYQFSDRRFGNFVYPDDKLKARLSTLFSDQYCGARADTLVSRQSAPVKSQKGIKYRP